MRFKDNKYEQVVTANASDVTKESRVALCEKRLLAIPEFQLYASLGRNNALKLAKESGAEMRIGRRLLVDRVKFDNWCDNQC